MARDEVLTFRGHGRIDHQSIISPVERETISAKDWITKHVFLFPTAAPSLEEYGVYTLGLLENRGSFNTDAKAAFAQSAVFSELITKEAGTQRESRERSRMYSFTESLAYDVVGANLKRLQLTPAIQDEMDIQSALYTETVQTVWNEFLSSENYRKPRERYTDPADLDTLHRQFIAAVSIYGYATNKQFQISATDSSIRTFIAKDALESVLRNNSDFVYDKVEVKPGFANFYKEDNQQHFAKFVRDVWQVDPEQLLRKQLNLYSWEGATYLEGRVQEFIALSGYLFLKRKENQIDDKQLEKELNAYMEALQLYWTSKKSGKVNFKDEYSLLNGIPETTSQPKLLRRAVTDNHVVGDGDSNLIETGSSGAKEQVLDEHSDFFTGVQLYPLMRAGLPDTAVLAYELGMKQDNVVPIFQGNIYLADRVDGNRTPLLVDHMVNGGDTVRRAFDNNKGLLYQGNTRLVITNTLPGTINFLRNNLRQLGLSIEQVTEKRGISLYDIRSR